jgi:hypothetical protein
MCNLPRPLHDLPPALQRDKPLFFKHLMLGTRGYWHIPGKKVKHSLQNIKTPPPENIKRLLLYRYGTIDLEREVDSERVLVCTLEVTLKDNTVEGKVGCSTGVPIVDVDEAAAAGTGRKLSGKIKEVQRKLKQLVQPALDRLAHDLHAEGRLKEEVIDDLVEGVAKPWRLHN